MQTAVINGEDWLSPRFREMLVGEHLGYNVANCRLVRTKVQSLVCDTGYRNLVFDLTTSVYLLPPFAVNHVSTERWPVVLVCLGFSPQGFNCY
jgi:hypothetical protein